MRPVCRWWVSMVLLVLPAGWIAAEELREPEPVKLVSPAYPDAARKAGQEGQVMVCFTIDEQGRVTRPAVRHTTSPVFDPAVLAAIGTSRFRPAHMGGRPVRSTACRTYRFRLE